MIKSFDGQGNISQWLVKLKLVTKMQKLGELQNVIPLFLEGSAFTVYNQMNEDGKRDAVAIENALIQAFAMNAYDSYDQFRKRTWAEGEPVDVYLSELRSLARLADIEDDKLLQCAFVVGLPPDVAAQVKAAAASKKLDLSETVEQARFLLADKLHKPYERALRVE